MGKRRIIQEEDKKAEQIKKEKDPITLFISLFSNQASKLKQMNVYHEWRKEMSTKEFEEDIYVPAADEKLDDVVKKAESKEEETSKKEEKTTETKVDDDDLF